MFRTQRNRSRTSSPPAPATPLRTSISALIALYTLYILYNSVFARPPNLFTALHLPLNAPQSVIRAALARNDNSSTGTQPVLPPSLEKLLARLASSDARAMLVRFGQRTVQTCTHCTAQADYALHALPPALLSYTLAAAVLGTVTVRGSGREARRGIGIMLLVFAGLCEAYWAYTVPITISPRHKQHDDIIMWHDTLWSFRHALFLALPLTLHLLPSQQQQQHGAPPAPPLRHTLAALSTRADALLARAHLVRLSAAGVHRVPELRARAASFWARERHVGAAVRRDADVRVAAERAGLGLAPPPVETRLSAVLGGSQDYTEDAQQGRAGVGGPGGGVSGEGALHKVAREAVAALKAAASRPPISDVE
ncbi:hypothetical protein BJV78DRAFT_1372547 [Lactifluus subvellereus]|nr:hypothetical protein BJV78DRAFT_1372547 [Lactifluus subvellereus]